MCNEERKGGYLSIVAINLCGRALVLRRGGVERDKELLHIVAVQFGMATGEGYGGGVVALDSRLIEGVGVGVTGVCNSKHHGGDGCT